MRVRLDLDVIYRGYYQDTLVALERYVELPTLIIGMELWGYFVDDPLGEATVKAVGYIHHPEGILFARLHPRRSERTTEEGVVEEYEGWQKADR